MVRWLNEICFPSEYVILNWTLTLISLHVFVREIMREIHRLRSEQEAHARSTESAEYNPTLLAELRQLRQRKDELESRMSALQDSRKELMVQLEGLMKLLKVEDEEVENSFAVDNCVFCSRKKKTKLNLFAWCWFG